MNQRDISESNSCIAHRRDDGTEELVTTHLAEVAEMAAGFARQFGGEDTGRALGMIHDIGKFSDDFQRRINDGGPKVDHSTAGAYELALRDVGWLSYCVSGHHGGMPDWESPDSDATLYKRIQKAAKNRIPDYRTPDCDWVLQHLPAKEELGQELLEKCRNAPRNEVPALDSRLQRDFSFDFFTRMCFSCLVDADFLCTERFMEGKSREAVQTDSLSAIAERFEERISSFYPPKGSLNILRCAVSDDCYSAGRDIVPGIFSLTVPTGGGKTLAGMRFALQHATKYGMSRIIVAEPYTAIIEQTADKYREYLDGNQTENVLEHHSNFDFDALDEDPLRKNLRLAAENWDMPIVVTTNVQLFESLFANSTSRCRKLHNIANSVIILDEAQTLPLTVMDACVRALVELTKNYHCTVVLCTATQPALDELFVQYGLSVHEIVKEKNRLFQELRRVTYKSIGKQSDDELVGELSENDQVLCIFNSRMQARNIAESLLGRFDDGSVFHLSTLMYPAHREHVLELVRKRLAAGLPCRVVSTSLIEAGVDLDFPVVYRSIAGLDSIIQAAGRCNREGKRDLNRSIVFIFDSCDNPESGRPYGIPSDIRQRAGITTNVIAELDASGRTEDYGSLSAIRCYFENLMECFREEHSPGSRVGQRIRKPLEDLRIGFGNVFPEGAQLNGVPHIQFASSSADFRFIDSEARPVVIPAEEISNELDRASCGMATRGDMRRIGRYSVVLYPRTLETMIEAGKVEVKSGMYLLSDLKWYSYQTGLDCRDIQGEGMFW